MAYGKKTGGRDFQKGHPKPPTSGAKPLPQDIKDARKLNKTEFERMMHKLLFLTDNQLEYILTKESTPMVERLIASIIRRGITDGSHAHMTFILNRMIGTVVEKTEVKLPTPTVVKHFGEDAITVLGTKRDEEEE